MRTEISEEIIELVSLHVCLILCFRLYRLSLLWSDSVEGGEKGRKEREKSETGHGSASVSSLSLFMCVCVCHVACVSVSPTLPLSLDESAIGWPAVLHSVSMTLISASASPPVSKVSRSLARSVSVFMPLFVCFCTCIYC